MTNKRFILEDDFEWWGIIDTTGKIKENEYRKTISGQIVVDLLNQLNDENEQLKTQIKIFEKLLDENNLDIDWEFFCTVDECKKDSDDYGCKECKYLGDVE